MKVVKVLWVDSCNSNMNWTVTEDIEVEPMYIDSFGIVVKDTDEFLAIAQNYGDNPEQYSNITTIPKGCIKEVFVIHEDNVYENEQKSAWSEEDEERLQSCLNVLQPRGITEVTETVNTKWLKSLKERVQPKQEWSEEDEKMLNQIIKDYERGNESWLKGQGSLPFGNRITWLKSLRPQNSWKPSDEQMKALWEAYKGGEEQAVLASLYSDLKKLREE